MQDRKSTKSVEQAVKEVENMTIGLDSLENIHSCIERAGKVCNSKEAEVSFYSTNGRLGSNF